MTLYTDAARTTLADVRVRNADGTTGSAYPGSVITVGTDSQVPLFHAADVDTLYYARGDGASGVMYARADDRLDVLEAAVVAGDMATQAELDAHVNDTTAAHAASAVSFAPTGTIAATTVQAALAEVASEAAASYVAKGRLAVDVRDYGAVGDGSTDDTAAIQAAINAAVTAGGGDVLIPDANSGFAFRVNGQLNLEETQDVTLRGYGSGRSESGMARLYFYGSAPGLRCGSSRGLTLSGLILRKLNAAYTGVLIDMSALTGKSDTGALTVDSCFIGSSAPADVNGTLIALNRVQQVAIRDTVFRYGAKAISRDPTIAGVNGEANGVTLDNCLFDRQGTAQIDSPGAGWSIRGCIFEPLTGGALAGVVTNPGTIVSQTKGLVISGCWFADALTSATGAWIQLRGADGVTITGNFFQCGGGTNVKLDGTVSGLVIKGNDIAGYSASTPAGTGIDFGAGPHVAADYAGNVFRYLTTNVTGTPPRDAISAETHTRARWRTGFYYGPGGVRNAFAHSLNNMILVPLDVPLRAGIDRLACEVTTLGASSVVRLGVYADDGNGVPSTLLVDAGTVDASTTGAKEVALGATLTAPVSRLWLAAVIQVAACTVRTVGTAANPVTGANNLANAMGANGVCGYGYSGVTGALPASLTASSLSSTTHGTLVAARAA